MMLLLCCDVWKWRSWKLSALCNRRKKQNPERDKAAVCWMPHRDIMFDYALQQWGRPAFASFKEAEGGISRSVHHHPHQQIFFLFFLCYFFFSFLLLIAWKLQHTMLSLLISFLFFLATACQHGERHGLSGCGLPSSLHMCAQNNEGLVDRRA